MRARLLDSSGAEKRLIWAIKPCRFWQNPVDIVKAYMAAQYEAYPLLGFDLIEMKEV
jgi:hypothetical protein